MLGVRGVKGGGDLHAGVHGGAARRTTCRSTTVLGSVRIPAAITVWRWRIFLAWQGPVSEEDDPYGDSTSPDGLAPVCHVQEIRILPERNYDAVKRAVYLYGGVQTSSTSRQKTG